MSASLLSRCCWGGMADELAQDGEVRLVRREPEHDEIGVGAAQDVMRVGIVIGLGALPPDEVHDLVLALARNIGIRENYLK